jgi:hypothetical protein
MEKLPLTPGPIVPAREQLGELLLQMNQPSDALQQFEAALAVTGTAKCAASSEDGGRIKQE